MSEIAVGGEMPQPCSRAWFTALLQLRPTARREVDLDIIRGIAILIAMGWHISSRFVSTGPIRFLFAPGRTIGWADVDLFFVLSGFLIGRQIVRETRKTASFAYGEFLKRRIFRLWPVLYTFLFAMLAFAPARDFFWQAALHVQNLVGTKSATHLWSLAVEEQFYLLVGLGFPILIARSDWKRTLPLCLASILVICPLLRGVGVLAGASPVTIQTQTQYRLDALAIGVLLAFFNEIRPDTFTRMLEKRTVWAAITAAAAAFITIVPKDSSLGEILGFSVSWMGGAAVLLLIYRSGIDRLLGPAGRAVAFVGQVSYPAYLWHVPVLKLCERLSQRLHLSPDLWALATYAGTIMLATMLTRFIEHPFMNLRDALYPPRAAPIPPTTGNTMRTI